MNVRKSTACWGARKGGKGGWRQQPIEHVAGSRGQIFAHPNPNALVADADLVALTTQLEGRFRTIMLKMLAQQAST